jgi:hypothetical protein
LRKGGPRKSVRQNHNWGKCVRLCVNIHSAQVALFQCPSSMQLAGTVKRLQGTIVILTCSVSLASWPTNIFLKTGEMRLNRNLCALMLPEQNKKKLAQSTTSTHYLNSKRKMKILGTISNDLIFINANYILSRT